MRVLGLTSETARDPGCTTAVIVSGAKEFKQGSNQSCSVQRASNEHLWDSVFPTAREKVLSNVGTVCAEICVQIAGVDCTSFCCLHQGDSEEGGC